MPRMVVLFRFKVFQNGLKMTRRGPAESLCLTTTFFKCRMISETFTDLLDHGAFVVSVFAPPFFASQQSFPDRVKLKRMEASFGGTPQVTRRSFQRHSAGAPLATSRDREGVTDKGCTHKKFSIPTQACIVCL